MAYDLAVQCFHRVSILPVHAGMSMKDVMELIGSHFDITVNSFELEIYDDRIGNYVDFDDEYADKLRQNLPRLVERTYSARVLFQEAKITETASIFNDTPSPSYIPANSPSSMSASEEIRSNTPDIDLNLCFNGNSPLPSNLRLDDDDFNQIHHLTFTRDIAPYQRSQYQTNNYPKNDVHQYVRKKNYIIRIQGAKSDADGKYKSILPEIKFPFHLLRQDQFTLVVAVVIEKRNEGQVSWFLNSRQGFLRDDVETNTVHYNPVFVKIDRSELTDDGFFELSLRMCTIPLHQPAEVGSAFYTLPENIAQKLHTADYEPNTSRLACVLADQSNTIQWDTFGISDFMRPKIYAKRKAEETSSATQCNEDRTKKQLKSPDAPAPTMYLNEQPCNLSNNDIESTEAFKVVLLDPNRSEIHQIHNSVVIFGNTHSLIEFLTDAQHQRIVLIICNCVNETLISSVHDLLQLHSIYILDVHSGLNSQRTKKWNKVVGIFDDINIIYQILKKILRVNESNHMPISFTSESSNTDLNVNSKSFIYQEYLKDIWSRLQYNENVRQNFVDACRHEFVNQKTIPVLLDEFNRDYDCSTCIWWYTRESFLYRVLNTPLRQSDIDTVKTCSLMRGLHNRYNRLQFVTTCNINNQVDEDTAKLCAGFSGRFLQKVIQIQNKSNKFIFDADCINSVYQQIERLHLETNQTARFTVYRGQGISYSELEKLKQNRNCLISMNSFLSTSTDRTVSYMFAESAQSQPDLVGILFRMTIDTSVLSKPLTVLHNTSHFDGSEREILLSMNSIFRVQGMKCLEDRLWQIDLTLTDSLHKKSKCQLPVVKRKITNESIQLRDLSLLLISMGEFEKAEKFFNTLPETELQNSWEERAYLYHQLGRIKSLENGFDSALSYFQRALKIREDNHSSSRLELSQLFYNIGMVFNSMGNVSKGISYLREALCVHQTTLKAMPYDIVMIYNNLGQMYSAKKEYTTSLLYFQKAIETVENFHASPDALISSIYFNISQLYHSLGNVFSAFIFIQKALTFIQKASEIYQRKRLFVQTKPANSYNIIRTMQDATRAYMSAFVTCQEMLRISEIYCPLAHKSLENKTQSIVKKNMSKAQMIPKKNAEDFIGSMNEVEPLNIPSNTDENRELTTWHLFSTSVRELLDEIDAHYTDKIEFSRKTCNGQIQDYLKFVIELQQPVGLIRLYTNGETSLFTTLNRYLAENDSSFRLFNTKNLLDSQYSNKGTPTTFTQHMSSNSLTNKFCGLPRRFSGTVYRGIQLKSSDQVLYQLNSIVLTRSFASISKDKNMVKCAFSLEEVEKEPAKSVFQVTSPRCGCRTTHRDEFSMEREILILPFSAFRVNITDKMDVNANNNKDSIRVFDFEDYGLDLS